MVGKYKVITLRGSTRSEIEYAMTVGKDVQLLTICRKVTQLCAFLIWIWIIS